MLAEEMCFQAFLKDGYRICRSCSSGQIIPHRWNRSGEGRHHTVKFQPRSIEEINRLLYKIGKKLCDGSAGSIYKARQIHNRQKVAVKYVDKNNTDYISIPGYAKPIPREIALLILANEGDNVPEIVQLLEWQDFEKHYIMVLDVFPPCKTLSDFLLDAGNQITEKTAKSIIRQATKAAYMCYKRGVFHRDIKLENFLINTDTLDIKLINFECGDLYKNTAYRDFIGTEDYFCPEYFKTGKYHAKSTTVYSLGVLLFTLLCRRFPDSDDKNQMKNKIWSIHGFSKECGSLIGACLQENPKKRILLEKIHDHAWLQDENQTDDQQNIIQNPANNESVNRLFKEEIPLPLAKDSPRRRKRVKLKLPTDSRASGGGIPPSLSTGSQSKEKMEDEKQKNWLSKKNYNRLYKIGKKLCDGAAGSIYEGRHTLNGRKVAVKYVDKNNTDYISIPGYAKPIPREIALLILANEGDNVPEIVQLLEWQDFEKHYIMVLDVFPPCKTLSDFLLDAGNQITEKTAKSIIRQATKAAYMCYKRGVFHRDIKLENFLINTDTLDIKLINFECGDLYKNTAYRDFIGTEDYFCPEYFKTGKYHAKSTTVYSLGVLLFTLLCRRFPDSDDKNQMKNKIWSIHGFSKECCSLIGACLQENPKERILLGKIHDHAWLQDEDQTDKQQNIIQDPANNESVNRLFKEEIPLPLAQDSPRRRKIVKLKLPTDRRASGGEIPLALVTDSQLSEGEIPLVTDSQFSEGSIPLITDSQLSEGEILLVTVSRASGGEILLVTDSQLSEGEIPNWLVTESQLSEGEIPNWLVTQSQLSEGEIPNWLVTQSQLSEGEIRLVTDSQLSEGEIPLATDSQLLEEWILLATDSQLSEGEIPLITDSQLSEGEIPNWLVTESQLSEGEIRLVTDSQLSEGEIPLATDSQLLEEWILLATDSQLSEGEIPLITDSQLSEGEIPNWLVTESQLSEGEIRLVTDSQLSEEEIPLATDSQLLEEWILLATDSQLSEGEIRLVTDSQLSEGEIPLATDSQLLEEWILLATDSQLSEGEIPLITDSQLSEGEIPNWLVTESQLSEGEIRLVTDSQLSEGEIPNWLVTDSQLSEGEIRLVTESQLSEGEIPNWLVTDSQLSEGEIPLATDSQLLEEWILLATDSQLSEGEIPLITDSQLSEGEIPLITDSQLSEGEIRLITDSQLSEGEIRLVTGRPRSRRRMRLMHATDSTRTRH
ncbi:uncharacterized protein LOC130413185 isoform X2 [Triplophysa dalaica]|uniref:uncharacterized protein LOC130413185 isoform X2 n=1 Tax=Triplophysa dalaica TaxID=1582913 RepID=UPI0024DFAC07|nr:uncharacterized protein LOC130413185 isoform X2 [Triplophysa dalaica]